MADQLSLRGGTTTEHNSFTGANKEVTVDTTKKTLVVHDGATAGGHPIMRENGSNSALSLGSAATPSLKFSGDTNTGIYSPGADQVALSTNGTGRLFVDASGNINIGGSDVGALGSAGRRLAVGTASAGNNGAVTIFSSTSGVGYLAFGDGTAGSDSYRGLLEYDHTSDSLRTYTAGSQRMIVTSAGLVGIGTSSPGQALDVAGIVRTLNDSPGNGFIVKRTGGVNANGGIDFVGSDDVADASIKMATDVANALTLHTAGSERLRVTSAGLVGIGTTPARSLHVSATLPTTYGIARISGNSRSGLLEFATDSTVNCGLYGTSTDSLVFYTTASETERARLTSSGQWLVGTSTSASVGSLAPYSRVQVLGNTVSGFGILSLACNQAATSITAGTAIGAIAFVDSAGNDFAWIQTFADQGAGTNDYPARLVFSTTADGGSNPAEQFRLTCDSVQAFRQVAPAAVDTTATLTVAQLKGRIITSSTAAAVTMTLPTGTDTEAGFSGIYTNMAFEWYVINTGASNAVTVAAGTAHTLVGSGSVPANTSGHFMSRRTAANTFVTYRLG